MGGLKVKFKEGVEGHGEESKALTHLPLISRTPALCFLCGFEDCTGHTITCCMAKCTSTARHALFTGVQPQRDPYLPQSHRKQASVSFNFLTVFLKSQTNICTKAWTLKGTYINWLKSTHLLNTEIIAIPPWSSVTAAYAARQSQTILSALLRAPDTAKAQTPSQRQVTECHSPYPMQVLLTRSSLHHWIPSEAHQNTRMAFLSKTFSREGRKCSRACCFRIVYVIKYSHSREVSIEGTCLAEGKDHHKLHLYGGTCNNHKLFQAKISTAFCTNKSCWLQKATKEKQRKGEGSADPQERLH